MKLITNSIKKATAWLAWIFKNLIRVSSGMFPKDSIEQFEVRCFFYRLLTGSLLILAIFSAVWLDSHQLPTWPSLFFLFIRASYALPYQRAQRTLRTLHHAERKRGNVR